MKNHQSIAESELKLLQFQCTVRIYRATAKHTTEIGQLRDELRDSRTKSESVNEAMLHLDKAFKGEVSLIREDLARRQAAADQCLNVPG